MKRNQIITRILLFVFFSSSYYGYAQKSSEEEIRLMALDVNKEMQGIEVEEGITVNRCLSYGRTIVYNYEVANYVNIPSNIKTVIIENYKAADLAVGFYDRKINIENIYQREGRVIKRVYIDYREFSPDKSSGIRLGELVNLKGHPKSKGVNIQLKAPLEWDINEGANPNVIKTFTKNDGVYMYAVLIKDNITFFSREESKKILNDKSYTNDLIDGILSSIKDSKILNKTIMTVANYPALYVEYSGILENLGADIEIYTYNWIIFYEDKLINLMGRALDKENFNKLKPIYYKITSSVVLPDQFN